MITIANVIDVTAAFLLKSRLEAEGIPAFIPDENTSQIQPLWNQAIGGVRVQVSAEHVEAARKILREYERQQQNSTTIACPRCHSTDTSRTFAKLHGFKALVALLGLSSPAKDQWICHHCGYRWPGKEQTNVQ